ncbi:MAG TPA: phospholipase D family protein [Casimicrobiaceae bacterium]|jgi:phosphatidylserine/phosphatidylglycerophosphate/cardiolipin synthase-like enzyme|nr:phospholipase D family protein [Casimicrobiaceae bacterium]
MRAATAAAGALAIVVFAMGAIAVADSTQAPGARFAATGSVETAFTPGDRIDNLIIAAIAGAKREVLVNAYSFTQRRIAGALVEARKRGVSVRVIADSQQAATLPQNVLAELAKGGVDVWLDSNYQAAHNKVVIVDADTANATTITGSYNFTVAAQWHNAENVLILRDNQEVANAYRDNWLRLKAHATPWPAARTDSR